jgi:hypothetical protein
VPRILDLDLKTGSMVIRLALVALFGSLTFIVFYYLPTNILNFIKGALPSGSSAAAASGIVSSLIPSSLPYIGLGLTALVFLGVVLRGTKVYGVIQILCGAGFAAYVYVALQGGVVKLTIPPGLAQGTTGSLNLDLSLLMLLMLIPPILTIVKGALLILLHPAKQSSPA